MPTNRWIDPPERPDERAIEALRAVCRDEPRIAELWITGSHFTRDDGHSRESTAIALVLDPPLNDPRDEKELAAMAEITEKLDAAWPGIGLRSCLYASREIIAAEAEHCQAIYARA
jgi:hypothetical protein